MRFPKILALLFMAPLAPLGAINISANGTYSQNFDFPTLIMTGTAAWVDDSTIPGWFAQSGNTAFSPYTASTGTLTTGDLYSYGQNTTATDRALGSLGASSTGNIAWGVSFTNTSLAAIQFESITFTGEQWRDGGNPAGPVAQSLTFSHQSSVSPITDLTPNSETSWTQVPGLTFTSPKFTGSAGALNGNLAGNRTVLSLDLLATNQLIFLSANQTIMFRWLDLDHAASDHGLGIDDVSIVFTVVPEPGTGGLLLAAASFVAFRRRRRAC